ncbi:MAG TPA: hypothetical protein PL193_07625 [Xanthobacteraceae bacterium]|nr:hypothetical protein [Xanthobacteraceae bacterium]
MSLFKRIAAVALQPQHSIFGELAAAYLAPGSGQVPVPCSLIISNPDEDLLELRESKVFRESIVGEVRESEVATPKKGSTFTLAGGKVLTIIDAPRQDDPDRLIWTFGLK